MKTFLVKFLGYFVNFIDAGCLLFTFIALIIIVFSYKDVIDASLGNVKCST